MPQENDRMMRRALPFGALLSCCTATRSSSSRSKVVSVEDAVYLVPSGCTLTVGGFVSQGSPEYVLEALGRRFTESGAPKDLTLLFGGGPGDSVSKGMGHFGKPGMLKRCIAAHYGQAPILGKMAVEGAFEAYFMPLGCVSRVIRCAAAQSPGHLTKVGFGTMMDPAFGGGKLNAKTTEDIVKVVEIDGEKYLFYKAIPIDVAIIRGTTADPEGNITMERESLYSDHMVQAMAGRSRRGLVIAQVERLASAGSLNPRNVRVPGTMVDCIVVAPDGQHPMSYYCPYSPYATGEVRKPPAPSGAKLMELDERKVIARRACLELLPDQVVNLGIGMPEGVAMVSSEEHCMNFIDLTTEPGIHGGVGLGGHNFGPAENSQAIIEMNQQFDFYNGGGLDICFLGNAETDCQGNVNVTRAGPKLTGPGGFIDISQCTPRVNLMGTFTAGGLEIEAKDGAIKIVKEGRIKKFVSKVKEITFSGKQATENGQYVNYITERCVFTLTPGGIELTEIAPGIDLQRDILNQMEFKPLIREPLGVMDPSIFCDKPMKLKEKVFGLNMEKRLHYCTVTGNLYLNLRNVSVYTEDDIKLIESSVRKAVAAVAGGKVDVVVAYDHFDVAPHLIDEYAAMTKRVQEDCYKSVRRVTSRALTRHKLAATVTMADASTPVAMTENEALGYAKKLGMMLSPTTFSTLFKKYSNDGAVISPAELQQLIKEAEN